MHASRRYRRRRAHRDARRWRLRHAPWRYAVKTRPSADRAAVAYVGTRETEPVRNPELPGDEPRRSRTEPPVEPDDHVDALDLRPPSDADEQKTAPEQSAERRDRVLAGREVA